MSLLKDKIELDVELAELKTKQALYGFPPLLRWILIICIITLLPAYLIAKSASDAYWNKVYQKYAITAKPSFQNPKGPGVSNVFMAVSGDSVYSAGVQVQNPNVDLSLPQTDYQFIFLNSQNEQVYRESGQMFLLPNESKYIVVPKFVSKDAPTSAQFSFTAPLNWQKRISIPKVDIQISTPNVYDQFQPPAFVVEGDYFNNSPYLLAKVRLTFLVYDKTGKVVALSRRDDFALSPYERRAYKQIWPNIYNDPNSVVKVLAETDTLDPNSLTLPQTPSSSSSDLSRPGADATR
jgi:hypothetical protein